MNTSQTIAAIAAALLQAQQSMGRARKSSVNPHLKSKYADLASVDDACRGPLNDAGIVIVQAASGDEKSATITTRLLHAASSEWIESAMTVNAVPDSKGQITPQALGSALSYARRYSLSSLAAVITGDDDDGHAATRPAAPAEKTEPVRSSAGANSVAAAIEVDIANANTLDELKEVVPRIKAANFDDATKAKISDLYSARSKELKRAS